MTTPTHHFDLVIIGAGSGNTIPGPQFASLRIAIIDDGPRFGGTCLNVGCIPTKMFAHPARLMRSVRDAEQIGVLGTAEADWRAVRDRIFGRIDSISDGGEAYRHSGESNITLFRERVRFIDAATLETASGERISGDRFVIAAGSRPRELEQLPFGPRVISSNEALRLDELPHRITIIGGGVIAAEFAFIFAAFGVAVTQLVRGRVLSTFDTDIAATFRDRAAQQWDVREQVEVTAADVPQSPAEPIALSLSDGSTLETDLVLVATGRIPNTDRLDTERAGFDHHIDGRLVVDASQRVLAAGAARTNVYALGDISNPHQLKHVANHEARIVVENLHRSLGNSTSGPGSPENVLVSNDLTPVPLAVFTEPEIATFGATVDEAVAAGLDAFEVRQDYGGTAWGWALEDTKHFAKLVVDRELGTILGAHIIGPDAPILLQPLVQAAAFATPLAELARGQYWPHPAATEIIENLLLNAKEAYDA